MRQFGSLQNPAHDHNHLNTLRKGKWTAEEETYVASLISEFKDGHILLSSTISLRVFLAKMVFCHPKRISKKFEGTNYNGKFFYVDNPSELPALDVFIRSSRLEMLERQFEENLVALETAGKTGKKPVKVSASSPVAPPASSAVGGASA